MACQVLSLNFSFGSFSWLEILTNLKPINTDLKCFDCLSGLLIYELINSLSTVIAPLLSFSNQRNVILEAK